MTEEKKPRTRDLTKSLSLGAIADRVATLILAVPDEHETERIIRARVTAELIRGREAIQEKITALEARIAPSDRARWPAFMLARMAPQGLCGFELQAENDVAEPTVVEESASSDDGAVLRGTTEYVTGPAARGKR